MAGQSDLGAILVSRTARLPEESRRIDYKEKLDLSERHDVVEITKDIAAMVNTEGGQIVVGVNKQHQRVGMSGREIKQLTPEDFSNKTSDYLDPPFDCHLEILERGGRKFAIIAVPKAQQPFCVMKRDGGYDDANSRAKLVFRKGDIFVRHSAKSERANRSDLIRIMNNYIKSYRRQILDGVGRVISAPPGSVLAVTSPQAKGLPSSTPVRISTDPNALPVRALLDTARFDDINQQLIGSVKLWNTDGSPVSSASLRGFYIHRTVLELDKEKSSVLLLSAFRSRTPAFFWASTLPRKALNELIDQVLASGHPTSIHESLAVAFALDRTDMLQAARNLEHVSVVDRAAKLLAAHSSSADQRLKVLGELQGGKSFQCHPSGKRERFQVIL